MSLEFEHSFKILMDLEGNDKLVTDSGGLTKYGISQKAYPHLDIKNITLADAKAIYEMDYWARVHAGDLTWPLNLYVFDCGVNQGTKVAMQLLQKALGDVAIDGLWGPQTRRSIERADASYLAVKFMAKRALRYFGTANFDEYGDGWLRRLFLLASHS